MGNLEKLLDIARGEAGYTESPANSNKTKYGLWYGLNGQPWCVIFLCWCFDRAGIQNLFYGGGKVASCSVLTAFAKKQKQWVTSGYRVGDLIMMDFSGKRKTTQHIGLVTKVSGNTLHTIEGNTSSGDSGSQDNGGVVAERKRNIGVVVGAFRPDYSDAVSVTKNAEVQRAQEYVNKTYNAGLKVDGIVGRNTRTAFAKAVQSELNAAYKAGLVVDGIFGLKSQRAFVEVQLDDTGRMVSLIQALLCMHGYDIKIDGIFGKKTLIAVRAFQLDNKLTKDGVVGKFTMSALLARKG